ncbi:unnamed protein product, partial [Didymodactylos carnosus]
RGHKRARYHRENPFIFFTDDDVKAFWPPIKDFFNIDETFPVNQLMTRIQADSGRNIYFVSENLKNIVSLNDDHIKFINMGIRLLVRTDLRSEKEGGKRTLRISQEGITIVQKYFHKRHISLNEQDVLTLLAHAMPYFTELSQNVQKQIEEDNKEFGSIICNYDPNESFNKNANLHVPLNFISWRGRSSLRPFLTHSSRKFYLALCNVDHEKINEMIEKLTIEEKSLEKQSVQINKEKNISKEKTEHEQQEIEELV